jgi:hypothetical protein
MLRFDTMGRDEMGAEPWRQYLAADLRLLDKAASRFRVLGWLYFFAFSGILVFSLAFAGVGWMEALFVGFIAGLILIGVSLSYFGLAHYIARGHRWAIAVGLLVAVKLLVLVLARIGLNRNTDLLAVAIETIHLLMLLELLRALWLGWGAAQRLCRWVQRRPVPEYGMTEEYV